MEARARSYSNQRPLLGRQPLKRTPTSTRSRLRSASLQTSTDNLDNIRRRRTSSISTSSTSSINSTSSTSSNNSCASPLAPYTPSSSNNGPRALLKAPRQSRCPGRTPTSWTASRILDTPRLVKSIRQRLSKTGWYRRWERRNTESGLSHPLLGAEGGSRNGLCVTNARKGFTRVQRREVKTMSLKTAPKGKKVKTRRLPFDIALFCQRASTFFFNTTCEGRAEPDCTIMFEIPREKEPVRAHSAVLFLAPPT